MFFLTGRRLKRLLPSAALRTWAEDASGVPGLAVRRELRGRGRRGGDDRARRSISRTGAAGGAGRSPVHLDRGAPPAAARRVAGGAASATCRVVARADRPQRFLLNKLLTGELRVGVSHTLVVRALAQVAGAAARRRSPHRLMGDWEPSADVLSIAARARRRERDRSRPYPVLPRLAARREPGGRSARASDWLVEWKWDGIRAQLIRRGGETFTLVARRGAGHRPLPRARDRRRRACPTARCSTARSLAFDGRARRCRSRVLQRRIGRQKLTREDAARRAGRAFMAYDLLEDEGRDVRARPLVERRARLEARSCEPRWARRACSRRRRRATTGRRSRRCASASRERARRGLMLKRLDSRRTASAASEATGGSGRSIPTPSTRCSIYAQPGTAAAPACTPTTPSRVWNGRRAGAVRQGLLRPDRRRDRRAGPLDPPAHRASGSGRCAHVEPVQVFELGFEGISRVTAPQVGRSRCASRACCAGARTRRREEADTLETVEGLIT